MKRILFYTMGLISVVMVLVGCGGGSGGSSNAPKLDTSSYLAFNRSAIKILETEMENNLFDAHLLTGTIMLIQLAIGSMEDEDGYAPIKNSFTHSDPEGTKRLLQLVDGKTGQQLVKMYGEIGECFGDTSEQVAPVLEEIKKARKEYKGLRGEEKTKKDEEFHTNIIDCIQGIKKYIQIEESRMELHESLKKDR